MNHFTRRDVLKLAGFSAAVPLGGVFGQSSRPSRRPVRFSLGIASYTFRAFPLEQVLAMTRRLGIRNLTLKEMHLPLTSSDAEIDSAAGELKASGIELTGCGVIYMKSEAEVRRAFAYAKRAGTRMIIGVPEAHLLDLTEQQVQATGISLAIHNHGPTDQRYPNPEDAYRAVRGRDSRMGLCVDVGHTKRSGLDPAAEIERFFDRVLDIHCKDVSAADKSGTTVEIGRGVIDIPGLLGTLARLDYRGILHCEHEKDEKDPLAGVAESIGYLRGVLATFA